MLGLILYLRRKKGKKPQTSPNRTGGKECIKPRHDAQKPYFLVQLHSVKVESEICADQQTQTVTPENRPQLEAGNETDADWMDVSPETDNIASRKDCNPEALQNDDNCEVNGYSSLYAEGNICQNGQEIETDHNIVNSDNELDLTSTTGSDLDCQSNGNCHKSSAFIADCVISDPRDLIEAGHVENIGALDCTLTTRVKDDCIGMICEECKISERTNSEENDMVDESHTSNTGDLVEETGTGDGDTGGVNIGTIDGDYGTSSKVNGSASRIDENHSIDSKAIGCTWDISNTYRECHEVGNNDNTISISKVGGGPEVINNPVLTTKELDEDCGIFGCSIRTVGGESGKINVDGLLTNIMDESSDVVHNVMAKGDRNGDKVEKCNSDNSGIVAGILVDKWNVLSQDDNPLNSEKETRNLDIATVKQKARHCKVGEVNGHCALNAHELGNGRGGVNGGHFIPNSEKPGDIKEASEDSATTDKATAALYHTDYILDETLGT